MRGERELAEAERHGNGVRILANTSSLPLLAAVRRACLGGLFVWKIEGSCLEIEFPFSRRQLCVYLADSALPVEIFLGGFMPPKGIDINHGERRILFVGNLDLYSVPLISD